MNRNSSYRTPARRGPSYLKHALLALTTLCIVPTIAFGFYQSRGNDLDSVSSGDILLAQAAQPPSALNLSTAQIDLPDILDVEDVASIAIAPEGLAGAEQIQVEETNSETDNLEVRNSLAGTILTAPKQENVPSQVLIDGQPIGSGVTRSQASPPGRFINNATGPLPRAPIQGLTRSSPFGQTPSPNARTGQTPLSAYARPFTPTPQSKKKTVALIVGGLGINAEQTRRAINLLPPEVTLSFAAHSTGLQNWINQARAKGHEVILELPMEPYNFDPNAAGGQHVLRSDASDSANIRNLDYLLSRGQGYFAVTNYLGEKFLDSPTHLSPVFAHIKGAGLGFIHDGIGQNQKLTASVKASNLAWGQNRSVIDVNPNISNIKQVLSALEGSANSSTIALGMGFSYPATIDAIIAWHDGMEERGTMLAPASATLSVQR